MNMNMNWDLNKLYTSLDSKEYKKDKEELKGFIHKENSLMSNFKENEVIFTFNIPIFTRN